MVNESDRPDQEPDVEPSAGEPRPAPKGRQSLAKMRRELSDDELASPAVQRLLVDEVERLERHNTELSGYRDRYHDADKRCGVLEVKARGAAATEILFGIALSVGAGMIGHATAIWDSQPAAGVLVAFGVVLTIGGVVARAARP